ncbi:ferredoxin--NADP reductase [Polyangium sp. 15x6]|uniref:ferredoxin--NADP reductase n=1 Tax=Polyangium sp. 15x6 TaxID=3042687 RepID=UPI00249BCC2E|nr:ferredoxin--NADP reductase [Polyangium sp. 15x6]MDI3286731.1 ferredoxin--NADP reductase [Polyangium sp. 15x6]
MNLERFHLTVESVRRPTPSSVELVFAPPPAPVHYRAGQYLTFHVPVDGRVHPRAYSLVGSPGRADPLSIIVKRVHGGVVSNHLYAHAAPGSTLAVSGPQGRFCVEPRAGGRHAILVAGGSGITPIHAMTRELLHGEPDTTVSLLYCNVAPEEILLRAELDRLIEQSGGRLDVVHVLEQGAADMGGLPGRLDVARATRLLGELAQGTPAEFYVCGPEGLMAVVGEALRALSVSPERIFQEFFARPDATGDTQAQLVTLRLDGKEHSVPVSAGATILEAATAAGISIETSCRVGDCGTCKLRCLSGEVEQSCVEGLSPDEEQSGYVLACVARPRTSGVVLEGP